MLTRGKRRLALGLFGATCGAAVWACSGFGDGAAPSSGTNDVAEAGRDGLAPLTGSSLGNYDMTVDLTAVRHGIPATAKITIARHPPFAKKIRIDLEDPPSGITADPLELDEQATDGQLVIYADGTVPQGPVTLTVRANVPETTLLDLTIPKDIAVQGAPGELDTSFGTAGVFLPPNGGTSSIFPQSDGSFFEGGGYRRGAGFLSHYAGSPPSVDPSFGADGGVVITPFGFAIQGKLLHWSDRILAVLNSNVSLDFTQYQHCSLRRLLPDGSFDGQFAFSDGNMVGAYAAVSSTGRIALIGNGNGESVTGWIVDWLDGSGRADTTVTATAKTSGAAPALRFGSYAKTYLYLFGDGAAIRLFTSGGGVDGAFGTGGQFTLPDVSTFGTSALDQSDRVLFGGVGPSGLVIGRIANGQLDSSWGTGGIATHAASVDPYGIGKIVQEPDGKVLQLSTFNDGATTRCVVLRRSENGALDAAFGTGGIATYQPDGCLGSDLVLTPDGKAMIGGPVTLRFWL